MQARIYTVEQVNNYIKNLFQGDYLLSNLYLKGEVSNVKYHSSGHIYFHVKDGSGSLKCVMFRGKRTSGLKFRLEDGQSVIIGGTISVYERDGAYQMYANEIQLDGLGDLYAEYERLKQKLYEEGLFEFEHKKEIPKNPKTVGIVTAATGAAIQDIMNIAKRRNPYVQLILYPARVQGEGAAQTIVKGIEILDRMQLDTIIIGRGGGSIEDLWAFNEECVARAIYQAKTPIISGTGHEVDTTIADYAADLRAPTPSAACELAIPDYMEQERERQRILQLMISSVQRKYQMAVAGLERYQALLAAKNPASRLAYQSQYLDELSERMDLSIRQKYQQYQSRLQVLAAKLHGMSPTAKLINGYGYLEHELTPLHSVTQVQTGDDLKIMIHDGTIYTRIEKIEKEEEE